MTILTPDFFARLMIPFESYLQGDTTAVAVSGGVDSLALVLLLQEWCAVKGLRLIALTVDHGLRAESREEAAWVGAQLSVRGITHQILTWYHDAPPKTRLQERARVARYDLLRAYCQAHGVTSLFLAHHRDDQKETRMLRFLRGSTLQGLAGMASIRQDQKVLLMRPLLSVPKASLHAYLTQEKVTWVDDPSNSNPQFQRVKVRSVSGHPSFAWLDDVGPLLASVRHHTDLVTARLLSELSHEDIMAFSLSGVLCLNFTRLRKLPLTWQKLVLEQAIAQIMGTPFAPRQERLWRLVQHLAQENPGSTTLGGCLFRIRKETLWIQREVLSLNLVPQENGNPLLQREVLGHAGVQEIKKTTSLLEGTRIPYETLLRLPAFYTHAPGTPQDKQLECVPALGYVARSSSHTLLKEAVIESALPSKTVYMFETKK